MTTSKREQNTLNIALAKACEAKVYDYAYIEDLLRHGAKPIGIISWKESDHTEYRSSVYAYALEHAFFHIWHGTSDNDDVYKLTELFIKYGMDITSPEEPYSYDEGCYDDPLLLLAQTINSSIYHALKLLLDKGIKPKQLDAYLHELEEEMSNGAACVLDTRGMWVLEDYTSKLLLIASYPQYVENETLRRLIWHDVNKTDLSLFRNWSNYEVYIDTAFYQGGWASDRAVIIVKEKATGTEVWRLGIGITPKEAIKKHKLDLDQLLSCGVCAIAINAHDSEQDIKQSCKCDRIMLQLSDCTSETKRLFGLFPSDYFLLAKHEANGDKGSIVFDTVFSCSEDRYVREIEAPYYDSIELMEILHADDGSIEGLKYRCDDRFLFVVADKDSLLIVKSKKDLIKKGNTVLYEADDSVLLDDNYEFWKDMRD